MLGDSIGGFDEQEIVRAVEEESAKDPLAPLPAIIFRAIARVAVVGSIRVAVTRFLIVHLIRKRFGL